MLKTFITLLKKFRKKNHFYTEENKKMEKTFANI